MKQFNHHHKLTCEQKIVDFGTGKFVVDRKLIPLLKALNEVGLITRTHCCGHKTGYSFVGIVLDNDTRVEIRKIHERDSSRTKFNGKTEILLEWKNTKRMEK